jgi:two-component system, chemotaxis family, CheB/CheR fusion protein
MRNNPFHIAALGASAGGLQAIVEFFTHVKDEGPVSYVVILHSLKNHKSNLREIVSRCTQLEVINIEEGMQIRQSKIYIAPQSVNVELEQGVFRTIRREPTELVNRTIDHFFKSLSNEAGEKAIAIVMSGTGKDGTEGFQAIDNNDGVTITQSPETAQFDGMPMSTLLFHKPKHVVPPNVMSSVITNILTQNNNFSRTQLEQPVVPSPQL